MILSQNEFSLVEVRVRCLQIGAMIADATLAAELQQRVVDAFSALELVLGLEAIGFGVQDPRKPALEAVTALERAAYQ